MSAVRLFLISVIGLASLVGCRRRIPGLGWLFGRKPEESTPSGQNDRPPGSDEHAANVDILLDLALYATWAGSLCFVIAVPVFVWVSKIIAVRLLICGFGLVISAQILIWVGEHLAWVSAIVLILTLALACWKYRKKIVNRAECILDKDLNGDGMVCDEPVKTPLQS